MGDWWPIEEIPPKVHKPKRKPSLWREAKQERHLTRGGVGRVGRVYRKRRRR